MRRGWTGTSWRPWLMVLIGWLWGLQAYAGTTVPKVSVKLIVTNAQGTVVATMTPQGQVTYTAGYRPYGQQVEGTPQAGPGYTGHVNDPDSGLVYMQQRYYDPAVGRFISPDPVGPTPGNVFNFNRFAYADDNPIRNIDPTGTTCLRGDHTHCESRQPRCGARCKQERQQQRENEWVRAFGGSVTIFSRPDYSKESSVSVGDEAPQLAIAPFIFRPPGGRNIFRKDLMKILLRKFDDKLSDQVVKKLSHGFLRISSETNGIDRVTGANPYVLFVMLFLHSEHLGGCHGGGYCDDESHSYKVWIEKQNAQGH